MRKQILGLVALFGLSSAPLVAQVDYNNEFRHNEVKLNLGGILTKSVELQYDYIWREDMSAGVDLALAIGDFNEYAFTVLPNYRWFFGGNSRSQQKYGAGFFIEANGAVFRFRGGNPTRNSESEPKSEMVTCAGLGLAVGWKYLSTGNWVGEIFIGGGRNFATEGPVFYPRGGLMIGYRF